MYDIFLLIKDQQKPLPVVTGCLERSLNLITDDLDIIFRVQYRRAKRAQGLSRDRTAEKDVDWRRPAGRRCQKRGSKVFNTTSAIGLRE
jgi:hypothetical protein